MATDQDPAAYGAHFQSLRSRALISPRAARRMSVTNAGGSDSMTFGPGPRSAVEAGWLHSDEGRNRPGEYGSAYQDLARAHMADDDTEAAFQRFQSQQYGDRRMGRDEGDRRNHGAVPYDHVDAKQHQAGGRPSKGGSAGPERGQDAQHIDGNRNSRAQPAESTVRAANRNTRLRDGEHWLAHYATRAQARPKQSNEYYGREDGTLSGDPPWRQD